MIYKNPINFPEIVGTPNTPNQNSITLFARNDGDLYKVNSHGVVSKIASNSGVSDTKTICFQYFGLLRDMEKLVISFPYNGVITDVFASCTKVGSMDTEIKIEKISKSDFINDVDIWTNIFISNMVIESDKKTHNGLFTIDLINGMENVIAEDRFRLSLVGETDMECLNVEIKITLN